MAELHSAYTSGTPAPAQGSPFFIERAVSVVDSAVVVCLRLHAP